MTNAATLAAAASSGFRRNRIHNGEGMISQLYSGAQTTLGVGSAFIMDRWLVGASVASKFSYGLGGPAASPFPDTPYWMKAIVVAAYTPATTEIFYTQQGIEGISIRDFRWGTAFAKPITLSFQVRSSVAGTYAVAFRNKDITRSYIATFTLAANTVKRVVLTIPGCTDGTWVVDDTVGLYITWDLGSGPTNNVPVLNAWSTGNYTSHASCVRWVSNAAATFDMTDVQLEVGTVATPFERQMYPDILRDCLRYRYYPRSLIIHEGYVVAGNAFMAEFSYPEPLRASPNITSISNIAYSNASNGTFNTAPTRNSARVQATIAAAGGGWMIFDLLVACDI